MKEVLKRLLEAEEAGRKEAAALEAAGEQRLREARGNSEQIVRRIREDTERVIEQLNAQADEEAAEGTSAAEREAAATIEQWKRLADRRRREAVARVVEMLLAELPTAASSNDDT